MHTLITQSLWIQATSYFNSSRAVFWHSPLAREQAPLPCISFHSRLWKREGMSIKWLPRNNTYQCQCSAEEGETPQATDNNGLLFKHYRDTGYKMHLIIRNHWFAWKQGAGVIWPSPTVYLINVKCLVLNRCIWRTRKKLTWVMRGLCSLLEHLQVLWLLHLIYCCTWDWEGDTSVFSSHDTVCMQCIHIQSTN